MRSLATRSGFTLIQIMIVVAIIGVLTVLAVVAIRIHKRNQIADLELTKARMTQTTKALTFYKLDHGKYPLDLHELTKEKIQKTKEPYLGKLERDAWDQDFVYSPKDGGKDFELVSYGADRERGGADFDADITATKGGFKDLPD
ncbi:MAG: type II secretion system protein GspG [Planctomycetes bacterium]|nr:type II secretion system protein GspG [Planctomycetota bacterium]